MTGFRRLFRARVMLGAAILMALAGPAGVAVAGLSGIGHRWVDILAQFVGPALAVALGLTAIAVLARAWVAALAGVAIVGLTLVAGAPQWFPPKGAAEAGSPVMTLYSANLHARNTDVVAMARSIQEADADLVILIEVGDAPAAAIDQVLEGYPHRVASGRLDRANGSARTVIAARRPLRDLDLRIETLWVTGAVAETALGPVTVVAPHLTRPWPYQYQWAQINQAQGLIDWRAGVEGPLIVAGDFNSVSSARIGRMIRAEAGLIAAPGWPGTWPTALPSPLGITIDQVYRSPDLALVERRLGRPTGSDHRPVITRFARAVPPAP